MRQIVLRARATCQTLVLPLQSANREMPVCFRCCIECRYKNCSSPIKLFKTKADVRQHIKNWHTLEKSEQREQRLIKKLEKYKHYAENYKKLLDQVVRMRNVCCIE